jgi:G:T-mismatch repair DNA endonuclease (very short patch repair protein)
MFYINLIKNDAKCQICQKRLSSTNKKTCSPECLILWGKLKSKRNYAKLKLNQKQDICKVCNKHFQYHYRPNRDIRVFCGRSCASKFYIKDGTFDKWKNHKNEKEGIIKSCLNKHCYNMVYVQPRFNDIDVTRSCSRLCYIEYMKNLLGGENNPMFGKTLTVEQKLKQLQTLKKNYGNISNAFMLAKRRTKTRPQIEIFEYVKSTFPELNFQIEKLISKKGEKEIFADIVSFDKKIVIEFNGDYWHCNPEKYKANDWNPSKKMLAENIWKFDNERIERIKSNGFDVFVMWGSDLKFVDWKDKVNMWIKNYA